MCDKLTIEDFIYWTTQTANVHYADPRSVAKYNKASAKAAEYWKNRSPDWCDEEYHQFSELVHHEDPLVRCSVIVAIIVKVKLDKNTLNEFLTILDSSFGLIKGECCIDFKMWIFCWVNGMIVTQNPYNGFNFSVETNADSIRECLIRR